MEDSNYRDLDAKLDFVHQQYITEQLRIVSANLRKSQFMIQILVGCFALLTVSHVLQTVYTEHRLSQKVNKRKWVEGVEDRS